MGNSTKVTTALVVALVCLVIAVLAGFWKLREVKRDVAHIQIEQASDRLCDRIKVCPWVELLRSDQAK